MARLLARGVWADKDGYLCVKRWRTRLALWFHRWELHLDPGRIGGWK